MPNRWTAHLRDLAPCKEVRQLLCEVEKRGGWVGRQTSSKHVLLRHTSGGTVTLAGTPRSPAARFYVLQHIRHAEEGR